MALYLSPDYQTSFESTAFSVQEKKFNIDLQDGVNGGYLGFPIRSVLTAFDLQIISILPMKFCVNWPFGSGDKIQNRFLTWRIWRPSRISDRIDFCYFWFHKSP